MNKNAPTAEEHRVESWLRELRNLTDRVGIEDTAESIGRLGWLLDHMKAGVAIEPTDEDRL